MTISKRMQNQFDSYKWTYLLGWLFIAVVALILRFIGPTLFQHFSSIVELIAPAAPLISKIILFIALLVLIPLVAGWLARILLKSMEGRRNVEALQIMQEKLFAEVAHGGARGFPVAFDRLAQSGFQIAGGDYLYIQRGEGWSRTGRCLYSGHTGSDFRHASHRCH